MFALAGDDGFAVQAADILAPESDVAGSWIGLSGVAVAIDAAVWCVTGRATAAVVEVSAENVSCRRHDLGCRKAAAARNNRVIKRFRFIE